jgi:hypothetical protein
MIIIPLAALLGIGAALSLYFVADRSSSKLPAFQIQLAKQNAGGAGADHSPVTSAAERKAKELRDARHARAIRRAKAASAARADARSRAAAAAAFADTQSPSRSTSTIDTTSTPVPAQPAPAPVSKPAPKPAPAPRRTSGGGGGGSFDDSG